VSVHTQAFLDDIRHPGPNSKVFDEPGRLELILAAPGNFIMQDDTDTSLFLPGAGAYAGYLNGLYANMPAVRAYAESQGAHAFSYTPDGDPGADGLDIEPGNVGPSAAPGFYQAKGGKGVYLYGSASWTGEIIAAMESAGIQRSAYKLVSAHYIGPHICGPSTCGYPQADATQFTDNYQGRSLDANLCLPGFFGAMPPPSPVIPPGWQTWDTIGMFSLAQLAKQQKTTITQIIEHMVVYYTNLPMNISDYLNAGDLNAKMPAGLMLIVPEA
jgi:hypothetical protein